LSLEFDVWTFSGTKAEVKRWYHIGYKKGILSSEMAQTKAPDHPFRNSKVKSGTLIRFKPDLSIFSEKVFPLRMIADWAQIASYFSNKMKIVFAHHSGKEREFYNPEGPAKYVVDQIAKLKVEPLSPKVFAFHDELVDCVFQLTTAEGCEVSAFTNGLNNPDKGNHFNSVFLALMTALTPFVKRGQEFGQQELRDGMVGLINVKLSSPKFSSQTKEKLVDDRAGKPMQEILTKAMVEFFAKNKSFAATLCERASELRKLKSKFSASKQVLNKIKQVQRIGLPAKASVSANCRPENRELFLLEGESAAGLCRSARHPGFQELLPLKGKVSNCVVAGTLVMLADGTKRPIESLDSEWLGFGFNTDSNLKTEDVISPVFNSGLVNQTLTLTFEDGHTLECTPEHRLLTQRGYVAAKDLLDSDEVVTIYDSQRS
jgi:DNA gyrase subunit B